MNPILFQHSLFYGLIVSAFLSLYIMLMLRINPELMWRSYPPAIKAKYGPPSATALRQRKPMALFMFVVLLAIFGVALAQLKPFTFLEAFVSIYIIMMVFNLVDLVILDWLICGLIRPKFIILPGTEGMKEYDDYSFAFKGFLKGCVICAVFALVVAAAGVGVQAVLA